MQLDKLLAEIHALRASVQVLDLKVDQRSHAAIDLMMVSNETTRAGHELMKDNPGNT